jgi:hypothetical protein
MAKKRGIDYPASGLFIATGAITPMCLAAKEFSAGQNAFTLGQMYAAFRAANHFLRGWLHIIFRSRLTIRPKQEIYDRNNCYKKN